jgi:hypothetical protein
MPAVANNVSFSEENFASSEPSHHAKIDRMFPIQRVWPASCLTALRKRIMKSTLRTFVSVSWLAIVPTLAQAHPGHDDPDFTWEYSHLAAHPVATLFCITALAALACVLWRFVLPAVSTKPDDTDVS